MATTSPWTERGKKLLPVLRTVQIAAGGVASAMDSWLVLRGIRTLNLRVEQQSTTALQIATYLQQQIQKQQQQSSSSSLITNVYYPGLSTHPQHDIAKQQMRIYKSSGTTTTSSSTSSSSFVYEPLFGGVLSVEFQTDVAAMAFAGALQTIQRATSLGGTETLIEHRASIEPPGRVTSPPGLLRISVGLEDVNDLLHDMEQSLAIVHKVLAK